MSDLSFQTAHGLARAIRERQVGCLELTDHFIARIERLDGETNAVVVRDFERARTAAREADASDAPRRDGRLHGVPVTIKESYDVAGLPTTWGIPDFRNNVAKADAEVVRRLREAGAIFLGKTNVPRELADFQSYNEIYGTTRNPWDLERTPGGSSGGSAVAMAAGFSALECGSDIGGSIRNPAHYCGVYGHKPTWEIVPPQGHALPGVVAGPDIAVCGPLARCAEDLALALDQIAGPQPLTAPGWQLHLPPPRHERLSDHRIAIWPTDELAPVDPAVSERVARLGEQLAATGATVSDSARPAIDVARAFQTYLEILWAILGASTPTDDRVRIENKVAALDPGDRSQKAMSMRGTVIRHSDWLRANHERERLRLAWRDFFEDWDVLICPQSATTAFPHDHGPMGPRMIEVGGAPQPYFRQLFWAGLVTAPYLPSTVFPTGPAPDGLPIGLQAVGAEYADRTTIEFTRLVAQEFGGFTPPPAFTG